jgi:uncharacterized membrane protein
MSGGWVGYALAFVVFVLAHALPARPPIRSRLTAVVGERLYLWIYSAVSLGLLYWLILAAANAPYVALWSPAPWQRWAVNLVMPVVILLVGASVGRPNPFSFGGSGAFDPERPGITALSRHPLLLAIALWAAAHLAANGNLAHALLFGVFAVLAVLGMPMLDRRRRRAWGKPRFDDLARNTSLWPAAAWLAGRARPGADILPLRRLALGLVGYLALLTSHAWLFGVSPLP